tara:strand:+ start:658 stop:897 length:240 start_codon:yes stop_codon:yes gene_type:complete
MSTIGQAVYHVHDVNNIEFGNVINEETRAGWKWLQINWVANPPTNNYKNPTVDVDNNWFRVDTVRFFEPTDMIESIRML